MKPPSTFGQIVVLFRNRHNLTQKDLCKLLQDDGYPIWQPTLVKYEKGTLTPPVVFVYHLSKVLDLSDQVEQKLLKARIFDFAEKTLVEWDEYKEADVDDLWIFEDGGISVGWGFEIIALHEGRTDLPYGNRIELSSKHQVEINKKDPELANIFLKAALRFVKLKRKAFENLTREDWAKVEKKVYGYSLSDKF